MPRVISAAALQSLLAQNTGEQFLVRLQISHPDLAEDLLLVNDRVPLVLPSTTSTTIREITNDQDATYSASPVNWTEGMRKTGALRCYKNSSDFAQVSAGPRPDYPFTVEAYFGKEGTGWGDDVYNLVYVGTPGSTTGGWILYVTTGGIATFRIWNGSSWFTASATNLPLDIGLTSYRLSGTYDGTTVKVFVDGQEGSTTANLSSQSLATGVTLNFGENLATTGPNYWIDDVRLWTTDLSAGAITEFRNRELVGNETNLTYYYPCNDSQYTAFPFEITLPTDSERGVPDVELRIDNVDREIVQALRSLSQQAPTVTIDVVTKSTPSTVEVGPIDFKLSEANYTAATVTGTLAYKNDILGGQFPKDTFNPSNRTGLNYLS